MTNKMQKSKNVANNVANGNLKDFQDGFNQFIKENYDTSQPSNDIKNDDLTVKMINAQLPDGFYYAKLPNGEIYIGSKWVLERYRFTKDGCKTKILAPVPSYEQWKALNENIDSVTQTNKALCKKLSKLKELLCECLAHLSTGELGSSVTPLNILLEEIKEALNV